MELIPRSREETEESHDRQQHATAVVFLVAFRYRPFCNNRRCYMTQKPSL